MVETQRFLRENLDSLTVGLFAQQIYNQGAKVRPPESFSICPGSAKLCRMKPSNIKLHKESTNPSGYM